jgi:hypothetical protein
MTDEQIRTLLALERDLDAHHRQRELVRSSLLRHPLARRPKDGRTG